MAKTTWQTYALPYCSLSFVAKSGFSVRYSLSFSRHPSWAVILFLFPDAVSHPQLPALLIVWLEV
jgi:hypothetical protein